MKINEVIEVGIGTLIIVILSSVLNKYLNTEADNKPENIEAAFNDYPLVAWPSTQKKWNGEEGDIIKIKYRAQHEKTFIQVLDINGNVVHKQPYTRNPWEDGRYRDFTYHWMLYYTEDYGPDIPPGDYQIQVCHTNSLNIDMVLDVTI